MRHTPFIVTAALLLAACGRHPSQVDTVDYQQDIDQWRAKRLTDVAGEDGWTTLVGLYWLKDGENRFGRAPGNELALDENGLPATVGIFTLAKDGISFKAASGVNVTSGGKPVSPLKLATDAEDNTTVLKLGTVSFYVIERVGHFGVRVKDTRAPARTHFQGLHYFPLDPRWRFEARFEPYPKGKKIRIVNVLGMEEDMDAPGALLFEIDGKSYRLDTVLEPGETDYFVMFADRTNGRDTYGAGRFLYVSPPKDGTTVLDFNKAYNPPCVFSPYATCPLPPAQNRLPLAVNAGELKYAGADH